MVLARNLAAVGGKVFLGIAQTGKRASILYLSFVRDLPTTLETGPQPYFVIASDTALAGKHGNLIGFKILWLTSAVPLSRNDVVTRSLAQEGLDEDASRAIIPWRSPSAVRQ
jgi:hypothetical protein